MNKPAVSFPHKGGVAGNQQSKALLRRSGSALQGRAFGWDGGEIFAARQPVFNDSTPSCAPRIGLQADAVHRAQRMRLESPASPPTLTLEGGGSQHTNGIIRFFTFSTTTMNTTPSGLQYEDTTIGTGAEAVTGQHVKVHYTGWLFNDGVKGAKFDSSKDRGDPFAFGLGAGQVIKGWDEGVQGMKVGGARTLVIPPELGYGARGAGGVIPGNATLMFDVELLGV
jgi:FKBP-type peptidyl-prolyl cis-trans isomerase FkpA